MKYLLTAAISASLSSYAIADPVAKGSLINWAGSGWHQVQSNTDLSTVCEGGTSCSVEAGIYTVINHSTGVRYENVVVTDGAVVNIDSSQSKVPQNQNNQSNNGLDNNSQSDYNQDASNQIKVSGDVISWPNDGWYQIQNASDYSEVCSGGQSCTVNPGEYIVVNHSTGNRHNIIVTAGEQPSDIDTNQNTFQETNFDLPADVGNTPAPTNISIAVYSETLAELNWTRPLYRDGISINEIWRDGVMLAEIPGGGNSYVDDTRVPSQAYTYHIVALNQYGRATTRFVETNGSVANPIDPVLSNENLSIDLTANLDNTFHLLNGKAVKQLFSVYNRLLATSPSDIGLTYVGEGLFNDQEYTCDAGGSMKQQRRGTDYLSFNADNCVIGPLTIDGRMFGNYAYHLKITDSRDNASISTRHTVIKYKDDSATLSSFESQILEVSGPVYNYSADIIKSSQAGDASSYEVSGRGVSGTLGQLTTIRLMGSLDANSTNKPTQGALAFNSIGTGNETYGLNFDNGNPDTFTLNQTINGDLTSFDVPWSIDYELNLGGLVLFNTGF